MQADLSWMYYISNAFSGIRVLVDDCERWYLPEFCLDRYDGRGHLYDLSPYDADLHKGSYGELSETEEAVERACEEERYLELHTDLMEQATIEEEEMKRLNEATTEGYGAVSFNYDKPGQDDDQQPQPQDQLEEEGS